MASDLLRPPPPRTIDLGQDATLPIFDPRARPKDPPLPAEPIVVQMPGGQPRRWPGPRQFDRPPEAPAGGAPVSLCQPVPFQRRATRGTRRQRAPSRGHDVNGDASFEPFGAPVCGASIRSLGALDGGPKVTVTRVPSLRKTGAAPLRKGNLGADEILLCEPRRAQGRELSGPPSRRDRLGEEPRPCAIEVPPPSRGPSERRKCPASHTAARGSRERVAWSARPTWSFCRSTICRRRSRRAA